MDASLLIYLNTLIGEQRTLVDEFFAGLLRDDLYTNLLVIDETLYISQSKYHVAYKTTLELLKDSVLPFATIIPIEQSDLVDMERYLLGYKIRPSDAIHLATMEKEGVANIATEDEELDKVKEIRRIWLSDL